MDPQMQAILDYHATLAPMHAVTVAELRVQSKAAPSPGLRADEVAAVSDTAIAGSGGLLCLRIYAPHGVAPFPLLIFFHGGGFVTGDLDTHDPLCRNFCAGTGCLVLAVDYRLAPEHRFPAAVEDCLTAVRWAAEHAAALGADPARIAVGGDSVGGSLAAVTARRLRDEGGPRLVGQILIYPSTDLVLQPRGSLVEKAEGYWLTRRDMEWFRDQYLSHAPEARHPDASPLRADRLSGLPPALVVTAEHDPLRDEAEAYAARLRMAGVYVSALRCDGVIHGFLSLCGLLDQADAALGQVCTWLRGVFAGMRPD